MKFTFRKFPVRESQAFPGKNSVLRPVIPVTLIHPNHPEKRVTLHCAIDSGSDHCLFPTSIATVLGLYRVESGPTWVWAGAEDTTLVAYLHSIILEIEGHQWECSALFSHGVNHAPYGILGLEGFFDRFNIQIDYKSGTMDITPNT